MLMFLYSLYRLRPSVIRRRSHDLPFIYFQLNFTCISQIKKKILCALIRSTLKKGQLHEIMRLFQEDSVVTTKFVAVRIEPPRYVIGTTSVMSQELS